MRPLCLLIFILLFAVSASAKDITLQWEPSPTQSVTGYNIYFVCGELVDVFPGVVDVGLVLEATLTGFTDADDCWFAATAYDGIDESVYSNIVFSPGYVKPTPPGQLRGQTKIRGQVLELE